MTFQQIKYFLCVAETGSISEAARRMYVAQSSVSGAIRDMEEYYGIQLFHRSGKGVALTSAGEELLSELRVIDRKMDFLKNKYARCEQERVVFSVAAQHHIFGLDCFLNVIKEIKAAEYRLCFLECSTIEIMENVERGYADIGLFFYSEPIARQTLQEIRAHNLEHHSLGREKIHIHMHKSHPLNRKPAIHKSDLAAWPCVTYDQILQSQPFSGEVFTSCPYKLGTTDRAAAYSMLTSMDALIAGTSFVPEAERQRDIIARPLEDGYTIQQVWVTRKDHRLSEPAQRFVSALPHL